MFQTPRLLLMMGRTEDTQESLFSYNVSLDAQVRTSMISPVPKDLKHRRLFSELYILAQLMIMQ
jgi:hypothetical protein